MQIADKIIGLLALGAVLFYVFKDGSATSSIVNSLASGFGTVEGSLQGQSNSLSNLSSGII